MSGAIAGFADVPVVAVRLGWLALTMVGGWGAVLYLATWSGLAIAQRQGKVTDYGPPPRSVGWSRWVGAAAIVAGLAIGLSGLIGLAPLGSFGVCVGAIGVVLQRRALVGVEPGSQGDASRWPEGRVQTAVAFGAGLIAAMSGGVLVVLSLIGFGTAGRLVVVIAFVGFVLALTTWPWWWGAIGRIDRERQARIRADERAAVSAHLHDSVLQTLVLIQNAVDSKAMVTLARRQERQLRNWLEDGRVSRTGDGLRGQLDAVVSELEGDYDTAVELVIVGDAHVDESLAELVAATREALLNTAQHARVANADVYVEASAHRVEVFVRDRGVGFDPSVVTAGLGVRGSIIDRLERVGGGATIVSKPGEGTEVEMWVPVIER